MSGTWPDGAISEDNFNSPDDSATNARAEILAAIQQLKAVIAYPEATGKAVMAAANAATARTAIGFGETLQANTYRATTASGTDSYEITPSPAITAYAAGQEFEVTFTNANTGAATLEISGVTTPPDIVKQDSTGAYVALVAGDIPAGHVSTVRLLSTTQALLVDQKPSAGGGASTSAVNQWTAVQDAEITTITYAATITPDFSKPALEVTLTGNPTIANPTNLPASGRCRSIPFIFKQDATGSRIPAWGSYYKGPFGSLPKLSTSANAIDTLVMTVISPTHIQVTVAGKAFA